jgi:cell wall-associated NlpC family hydrolase
VKPPAKLVPIYKAAARRYHLQWQVLAAINAIETDYGSDETTSSAGAVGWMQFMPSTWREYEVDATASGTASPYNPRDAIFAAARLLAANGGEQHLRRAVFAYNHATWYVNEVVFVAARIVGDETRPSARAGTRVRSMLAAAELLNGTPYVWGGGHSGWDASTGYDCSGFVSAVLHAAGYLDQPATTQTLPDESAIKSGPGRWVTIFDRTNASSITGDHVIIDLDGQWWESGGSSAAGGGADVHRISSVTSAYLATFNVVLHPRGL